MAHLKATYKEILHISLPLILGNTAWTSIGVFDTIFVGNLGKVQLDAIGFASIFYSVLFMMGFGFTRGTQILIARTMGELNKKQVGNIFDNTLWSLGLLSVLMFIGIKLYSREMLEYMLTNKDIIDHCQTFLDYRMWGLVASFISCIFIAFYSGIGQTITLFFSIVVMSSVNIFLNWALVYGKVGFPEMGIAGSGLASTISEWLAVLVLFGGTFIKGRRKEFMLFKFAHRDFPLIGKMANISIPLMMQSLVAVGAWLFLFARIETVLGKDALAVSSIFRQLILFFTIPTWSLGSTANTVISNLVGQNDVSGVKIAIRKISLVSLAFACLSCLIIYAFPQFCVGVFTSKEDYMLVPLAVNSLSVIFVVMILMSFSNIIFNGVISVGSIYYALAIEVLVIVLYIVYFQYLFTMPWVNVQWIWTAEWVYWIAILILSLLFFRFRLKSL
jgi:putative MATE family efflux protein